MYLHAVNSDVQDIQNIRDIQDIRDNQNIHIQPVVVFMAVVHSLLQIGEFYFSITLEEPYRSYKFTNVPISTWLLVNGLLGINISILFVVYNIYNGARRPPESYHNHLSFAIILYFLLGMYLTIIGWIGITGTLNIPNTSNMPVELTRYIWVKISLQTSFYTLFGMAYLNRNE